MNTHAEAGHGHGHGADHVPHVLPMRNYLGVWLALLTLTALTVGVSYFDFGTWNIVVAMAVATTKAILVAAIFMHLLYDNKFNAIVIGFSVIFLAIMISFTMFDTEARHTADPIEALRPRDPAAPFADGKMDVRTAPAAQPRPAAAH